MSSAVSFTDKDLDIEYNIEEVPQKPVKRLFTPFLSKTVPPIPQESDRKPFPLYHSNFISKGLFLWLLPLLKNGYKRTLQQQDLWKLDEHTSIDYVYSKYKFHFEEIITKHQLKNPNSKEIPRFALVIALLKTFQWEYTVSLIVRIIANALGAFSPIVSKELIKFIERKALFPNTKMNDGIGYSIGLTLMLMLSSIIMNQSFEYSKLVGGHARTILTKALLEHSFIANAETRYHYPPSKIISFMSADLSRIDLAFGIFPIALAFPVPIIIGVVLLIVNLGVVALVGIAIFLVILFIMTIPSKSMVAYRIKANVFTDERVGIMREVLQSMKIIKFYSWEDAYEKSITLVRDKESSYVFKFQMTLNILMTIAFNSSSITSMGAFLVLYAIGNHGNPANIFASLTLFTVLAIQVTNFPLVLSLCADGLTAVDRLTKFFQSPVEKSREEDFYNNELITNESNDVVKIIDGEFEWTQFEELKEDETPKIVWYKKLLGKKQINQEQKTVEKHQDEQTIEKTSVNTNKLHGINLTISKGEFIVITGSVGSGKSSLLSAISSFMTKTQGTVSIKGSHLLCGEPWIQNTTVKENILFGEEYDLVKYNKVVDVCALTSDFKALPAGDLTEIGERGVTLSGGQKARINLARAIYTNRDVYLFDDILSAVDANVGKHIIDNCLLGYIKDKTRILASHQLSLINKADRVVFLKGDGTIDIGTESELRLKNPQFVTLMEFNKERETEAKLGIDPNDQITKVTSIEDRKPQTDGVLGSEEERVYNSIPLIIYKQYVLAGQGILKFTAVPITILSIAIAVFSTLFANVWLSFWVSRKFSSLTNGSYIGIYIGLTIFSVFANALELFIMGYIFVEASKILNLKAVKRILHTPMQFIDTTPIGRILNRFSKDTNSLDNEIGQQLKLFLHFLGYIMGIIILAIIYLPWFAIAVPFLAIFFIGITNFYQASAREVKRLEAINRSFVYNNFNEVTNGLNTIKAYGAQERFIRKNDKFVDGLNEVYFVVLSNQRWISVALDCLAGGLVFIVSILSVTGQFNINASSVGLLTYYMVDLSAVLSALLVAYAEVENEMNSVERVCHYANNLEQESAYRTLDYQPRPTWPEQGSIEFKNLSFKYRDDLPLILKNLSFNVEKGEKIGICGRTGAGKSSLMVALYRIAEFSEGQVFIDGVDISKLGIHDLRSKLSIIPQDPVLFQGNIRKNLDPFNESTESELWDALRRSGLITFDEMIKLKDENENEYSKFHLNSVVEDEGSNFSLGERQLLALARALVRRSKILIMDEATSSVDYKTDSLVQETIAREFSDCTILCIAHRLKTIIRYDKILVLEKGELEEFDKPLKLFQKRGIFREMCEASNLNYNDFV
ncbi:putative membrane protein [Wickerhamomyces ciferrii]|uniref:Membrane protein n=1 Tax=Wickerhamomyces ciferrii (strain ATCC 14091 / BCRC 22168 / CBS 111 / JCM 3599 / NBRC 0793 / NRRL Y-1031 F-60-10) TaxID=1206466 RepID=K0KZQ4_WICCF|nr:uncharacterized protein BN7_6408 [Wickerhamomyces ciferrii]CCH46809.1 putative membrane protein [Wickerhamomyces ciferrii]